jgi:hypothetical protein
MKTGADEHGGILPFQGGTALVGKGQCQEQVQKTMCRQWLMAHQCHSFILPYAALPPETFLSPISAILMPAHVA